MRVTDLIQNIISSRMFEMSGMRTKLHREFLALRTLMLGGMASRSQAGSD